MQGIRQFHSSRHELKYVVDEAKARAIREFVCAHLASDPFSAPDEGYPVSSIYLDSLAYELYAQSARGQRNRFKLRVRYYDDDPVSPVFFEIKRRDGAVIRKQRSAVGRHAASRILRGEAPSVKALHAEGGNLAALHEFCRLRQGIGAFGYTYVGYHREAFGSKGSLAELRVTFDRKLAAGTFLPDEPFVIRPPRISPEVGGVILELKFTDNFPRWMHDLVQTFNLQRQSVPKYNTCVDALGVPFLPNGATLI